MPMRPRHPDKEIEAAVRYAESQGWIYKPTGGSSHAWGRLLCPLHTPDGCQISIWSTPRSAQNHAKAIRRDADRCHHCHEEDEDEDAQLHHHRVRP